MRKPKKPQDIQDQVQRIACAIADRVDQIEVEHRRLVKRMNRLGEMAEKTRNPHALVHPDSDDVWSCIQVWEEIPVFFPNVFELRGYLYKLRKGDKHYGWKPVLCFEGDEDCNKEAIRKLKIKEETK